MKLIYQKCLICCNLIMDEDLSKNLNFFREKNNIEEVIRILLIEKNNKFLRIRLG